MPSTLQEFLAAATQKASGDLVAAFLRLPEDKRDWSPEGGARSALDQVAECALLNGYAVQVIRTWEWPGFEAYLREKEAVKTEGWERLRALLDENTRSLIATVRAVPDDELSAEVPMIWGKQTMAEIIAYPYWNIIYHQGQINYIASMLGCLA